MLLSFSAQYDRKKRLTHYGQSRRRQIFQQTAFITKVLVSKSATGRKRWGIVEIETNGETQTAPVDEKIDKSGGVNLQAIETEITNAENEVERTSVEVQRVESLVATNSVPQAQLDAARADFQKAQELLQNVREKKKNQETALLIERSRGETVTSENMTGQKNCRRANFRRGNFKSFKCAVLGEKFRSVRRRIRFKKLKRKSESL